MTIKKKPTKREVRRPTPSRIDALPEAIKKKLNQLLRNHVSQVDILKQLNLLLENKGDKPLSKAGLSRHVKKIEIIGKRIRDARTVADAWTAKFGEAPTGDLGKHINNVLQTLIFEFTLDAEGKLDADGEAVINPKVINELALAVQRLEKAAELSTKRDKELTKAFMDKVGKVAAKQGLSKKAVANIRQEIEG